MMGFLMQFMGWAIGVPAVVFGIMFFVSLRMDKGGILFSATLGLMKGCASEWYFQEGYFSWNPCTFTRYKPTLLMVKVGENPFNTSVSAGNSPWVRAGFAWSIRLHHAAWAIYRDLERIKRLNAICDGIEDMAEKNVIRLRDRQI